MGNSELAELEGDSMRCFSSLFVSLSLLVATASAQFSSSNMTLYDHLPLSDIGGGSGSDLWGWTDPLTSREYALMGRSNGVAFVDVTDPANSVYLGNLPSATGSDTLWRDIKTYENYAYVVADGSVGPHGLQVFDLTNLRGVDSPRTFNNFTTENTFRNAHNLVLNEESGFAYVVGSDIGGGRALAYDLSNPANPNFTGVIEVDGYIHDAQVVNYRGPDPDHQGREIMFSASVNDFVIIDVTDKSNPFRIWEDFHPNTQYTHQGWLSEDQATFYINDELDTRWTHKWDITDVDNPIYRGSINETAGTALDHNLYVKGKYQYQANYTAGIRVFEMTNPGGSAGSDLQEVAWFDTYPENDFGDPSSGASFVGAWTTYPFFDSGTIITSDLVRGLFVTRNDYRPADFNADGYVDCTDVDQLTAAIVSGSAQTWFDLDDNGSVDQADLAEWLALAGAENLDSGSAYLAGDINLDGLVDGADFLIWNANKFMPSDSWCQGDLNADGTIDGGDFLVWNNTKFQSSDGIAAVPEPGGAFLLLGAFLVGVLCREK